MRSLLFVFKVLLFVLIISKQEVAADDDGDCYFEQMKLTIKRGETVYPEGECLRLSCSDEGKLHPEPCEMGIPPDCHIFDDGDMTKQWPGCCPVLICDEE